MPVLHPYQNHPGHFVKASIRGAVVTFQITAEGVARLRQSEIGDGEKFPLSLLFDLAREGMAYTGGRAVSDPGYHEAEQFEFDFPEDRENESLFPSCAVEGTVEDLHLVTHGRGPERRTELLSAVARERLEGVELSMPFGLVTAAGLDQLLATGKVVGGDPGLVLLGKWLQARRSEYWEGKRLPRPVQASLGLEVTDELTLF